VKLADLLRTLVALEVARREGEDSAVLAALEARASRRRYALDVSRRWYRELRERAVKIASAA
jgi:hypothetical protein